MGEGEFMRFKTLEKGELVFTEANFCYFANCVLGCLLIIPGGRP